jgi:nicotinamidase-related amidase
MEPFKPGPDDVVIDKRRPSMFVGNEFETILHNRGATTVVMVGCTTDGGVEMTVRDGHNRGHRWCHGDASARIPRKATLPRSNASSASPTSSTERADRHWRRWDIDGR